MEKKDFDGGMANKLDLIEIPTDQSNVPMYNQEETNRILRRVDFRLLPMLTLLYVLSFIDRSNSMGFSNPSISLES